MFAIEYAGWFAVMLPGMARFGIPIPLGGTSNHFRASVLREIGGWDAYNVTEDADVGLRLARAGHRAAPLNSVTWEEAMFCPFRWVKQRSRWVKGYIQTALVHARAPRAFARAVGWPRYLACIAFLAGAAIAPLVSPLLLAIMIAGWFTQIGPHNFASMLMFSGSLVFGTGLLTVLTILGPLKTGEGRIAPLGAGVPLYWLLMSAGAWKAVFELFIGKSSFWEKSEHGIEYCRPRRRTALTPRLAYASAIAISFLALTSYAALGNPWLKQQDSGEVVGTLRAISSADGLAGNSFGDVAADFHGEYGISDAITLVADGEAKGNGEDSGAHLEFSNLGIRTALTRWDTGVLSIQSEIGAGEVRNAAGVFSLHAAGETRVLFGQDFDLWGNHSWIALEAGYRWRPGPPADEAVLDMTLGVQPRDDLFFMLQSFGVQTVGEASGGYRGFKSDKLQLSAIYEVVPQVWVQAGGIASVYGDDAGNAGGMLALWWRF